MQKNAFGRNFTASGLVLIIFSLDNNQTEFKIWTSHKIVLYTARKQL